MLAPSHQNQTGTASGRPSAPAVATQISRRLRRRRSTFRQGMWPRVRRSWLTCKSGTESSRSREPEHGTIPIPRPPWGKPRGGSVEGDDLRAGDGAALAARQLELGAGLHLGRAHRDELDRPLRVGVAVALLVGAVERAGEVGAEWDGQLERLAGVAQIGLALRRQLARLLERADEGAHGVAPLVARDQSERR